MRIPDARTTMSFPRNLRKATTDLDQSDTKGLKRWVASSFSLSGARAGPSFFTKLAWPVLWARRSGHARRNDFVNSCLAKLCCEAKRARVRPLHRVKTD